jgi:hypothetical protein
MAGSNETGPGSLKRGPAQFPFSSVLFASSITTCYYHCPAEKLGEK